MEKLQTASRQAEIEATFITLANQWREENRGISSTNQMCMHPAYQQIIGMGEVVIPLLLRELEKKSGRWFWALKIYFQRRSCTSRVQRKYRKND